MKKNIKPIAIGKSLYDIATLIVGKDGKIDRARITTGDCVS
jgi:hypothetical protein